MKKLIKILITFFILAMSTSSVLGADIERNDYNGYNNPTPTQEIKDAANQNKNSYDSSSNSSSSQQLKDAEKASNGKDLDPLKNMSNGFYGVGMTGEAGIYNFLVTIAKDMKNVIYSVVLIYFVIMVLKLLYTGKTEEEFQNFKKGMIWTSVGLMVMQSSYSVAVTLYQPKVDATLGELLITNILNPIIQLMLFLTGFLFLGMMVYSAYRFITSNGKEDKIKKGKDGVIYSIIGYIMVKISSALVKSFYGDVNCSADGATATNCKGSVNLEAGSNIITDVVNWMNTSILVIVTIIIIYAGGLMLTSGGDETKMESGKKRLFYALIGVFIVAASYTITVFFLTKDPSSIKSSVYPAF